MIYSTTFHVPDLRQESAQKFLKDVRFNFIALGSFWAVFGVAGISLLACAWLIQFEPAVGAAADLLGILAIPLACVTGITMGITFLRPLSAKEVDLAADYEFNSAGMRVLKEARTRRPDLRRFDLYRAFRAHEAAVEHATADAARAKLEARMAGAQGAGADGR